MRKMDLSERLQLQSELAQMGADKTLTEEERLLATSAYLEAAEATKQYTSHNGGLIKTIELEVEAYLKDFS